MPIVRIGSIRSRQIESIPMWTAVCARKRSPGSMGNVSTSPCSAAQLPAISGPVASLKGFCPS